MLPCAMRRNGEDNRKRPLQCSRCEDWIGQWSLPLNRWPEFFTHCEICMDTLCEFCSEESIRKPTARVQRMLEDPAVYKEIDHWAITLNKSLFRSRENWILDLNQILDLHRYGKVQWRRNDFSLKDMNKQLWGPDDYVMDPQPFHKYELKQAQKCENIRIADKKPIEFSWSCAGINPKELDANWQEEHE